MKELDAFGAPGSDSGWTQGAKDFVTTGLGPSRLWATIGAGVVNEVYWPSPSQPQVRELSFIVANDMGIWTDVSAVDRYSIQLPVSGVPLAQVEHYGEDFRLVLEILPDPYRDVLLISYELRSQEQRLNVLVVPHLGSTSFGNTAWVASDLLAQNGQTALCVASATPFSRVSAGFTGFSDGRTDFRQNGRMTRAFKRAADGSVTVMGELSTKTGVVALALASTSQTASALAHESLEAQYKSTRQLFVNGWKAWSANTRPTALDPELERLAWLSAVVLKVHEDRNCPGAVLPSLAIPWGETQRAPSDYQLIWVRDVVEAGLAFVAAGQLDEANRVLFYLANRQLSDGSWRSYNGRDAWENQPDGPPQWRLDDAGLIILLAANLVQVGRTQPPIIADMIRGAAHFLAQCGPCTYRDLWESDACYSPLILGVEVAALVTAAGFLDPSDREYALSLADYWNEQIENWTYLRTTQLAASRGAEGYYANVGPLVATTGVRSVPFPPGLATLNIDALVTLDFIYLLRLGLRSATDARMEASVRVADSVLGVQLHCGMVYHRSSYDHYGEQTDGSAFAGTGIGRAWPLLVAHRAYFDLTRGQNIQHSMRTLLCLCGRGGMLPEQVWDSASIPEKGLMSGKPTGSVMPLVLAHAELLKLLYAQSRGTAVEHTQAVRERYAGVIPRASTWFWRENIAFEALPTGRTLVVEDFGPFHVRYAFDDQQPIEDAQSTPLGLGMHGVRFDSSVLADHRQLHFTCYDPADHAKERRTISLA